MGVVSWTLAVSSLPFVFVCSGVSLVLVTLALTVKASPPGQQPGSGMQPAGSMAVKIFKCLSLNSEIIKFGGELDLIYTNRPVVLSHYHFGYCMPDDHYQLYRPPPPAHEMLSLSCCAFSSSLSRPSSRGSKVSGMCTLRSICACTD